MIRGTTQAQRYEKKKELTQAMFGDEELSTDEEAGRQQALNTDTAADKTDAPCG